VPGAAASLREGLEESLTVMCLGLPENLEGVTTDDQTNKFETPPVLHAKDLAPTSLLTGKGFNVDDAVPTDGLTGALSYRGVVGRQTKLEQQLFHVAQRQRVPKIPADTFAAP
jgi:hypothetical protein